MLVLSRKRNESLMIGHDIEVVVVDIRGDKVRLGTRAPGDVAVHRSEIYDAILAEGQEMVRGKGTATKPGSDRKIASLLRSLPLSVQIRVVDLISHTNLRVAEELVDALVMEDSISRHSKQS